MLIQDIMQTNLVTVTPRTTLPEAVRLARERGIRHLPVVDGERLVGIVSDRDLKRAMASPATSLSAQELTYLLDRLSLAEIMTRAVITIAPMFPVEDAARIMVKEKISALPVTEAGRLVGIVTETDVLELFVRAMGAGEPSSRLGVAVGEDRSALAEIVQAVEGAGAPISSIMTLRDARGVREVIVRVATMNPAPAIEALAARGYALRTPVRAT
ncbi:MAG: CBS domain-containing protein [Candidatus Rokubacteria bacterium]|nr:CBS domain-containing protein [Candidatus Rokubacteria bacterium]